MTTFEVEIANEAGETWVIDWESTDAESAWAEVLAQLDADEDVRDVR